MNIGNKDDYIKYRFQRAEQSFEEVLLLVDNKRWNAAINRMYYACFYAASALLLKHEIKTQTHDGVRMQFGLQFVKTNLIDRQFGKLYSKLFDYRQKGDYGDLYDFDENTIKPLVVPVRDFINEVRKHVFD
jgi:uncharacterized protein